MPGLLRRGTRDSLIEQAPHTEFADVSAGRDSYYELFVELWQAREDFMLVEHDIVIAPGTVAALGACPHPWCACPISVHLAVGNSYAAFQCNRWRRELMTGPLSLPARQRDWPGLSEFVLARMTVEVHTHVDLPTFHLAPGMGSTL